MLSYQIPREWESQCLAVEKPYTPYYGKEYKPSQRGRSPSVNQGCPSYSSPPGTVSGATRVKLSEIANRYVEAHKKSSQSTIQLAEKIKNQQRTKEDAKRNLDNVFRGFSEECDQTREHARQELHNLIDNRHPNEGSEIVSTWQRFLTSYQPIMKQIWSVIISVITGVINFFLVVWDGIKVAYEEVKVYFMNAWDAIQRVFS